MKKYHVALFLVVGFFAVFAFAPKASAATCTFIQVLGNDFHESVNWNCDHIPNSLDDIIVQSLEFVTLSQNESVKSVQVDGGGLQIGSFQLLVTDSVDVRNSGYINLANGILNIGTTLHVLFSGELNMTPGGSVTAGNTVFNLSGILKLGIGTLKTNNLQLNTGMMFEGEGGVLEVTGNLTQGQRNSNPSGSTIRFSGSGVQTVYSDNLYDNVWNHIDVNKTGGSLTWNGSVTSTGNVTFSNATNATIDLNNSTWNLYGNFMVNAGGKANLTSTTKMTFRGSAPQSVSSTALGDIMIDKNIGAVVTFTDSNTTILKGIDIKNGVLNLGNGTTNLPTTGSSPLTLVSADQLQPANGTVQYESSQDIAGATFWNLTLAPGFASVFNVSNPVSINGSLTVNANSTIAVGSQFITIAGTFNNNGNVTRTTGGVKRVLNYVTITDVNLSDDEVINATVNDPSVNLNGKVKETLTVTIQGNAAIGSDTETLTLTESSNGSGDFTSFGGMVVVTSTNVVSGNGIFEATADGSFTVTYTDASDPTDTGTANGTVDLTFAQQQTPPDTTVSQSDSSMAVSPTSVSANNASTTAVTVTVKNVSGTPLAGKTVSLSTSRPSYDTIVSNSFIDPSSQTTDSSGKANYFVKSSTVGSSTLTATVDGKSFTASVTFTIQSAETPPTPIEEAPPEETTSTEPVPVVDVVVAGEQPAPDTLAAEEAVLAPVPVSSEEEVQKFIEDATAKQTQQIQFSGYLSDIDDTRLAVLASLGLQIHSLVKLSDDGDPATQADSAVYYIGGDGKRHAFPNERVFRTWFCDFSGVRTLSQYEMATIQLGQNVTYQPGRRMVKFTTGPKVYAVDKGGILRWVTNAVLAGSLYGDDWSKRVDDVSDAFFSNYEFGEDIDDFIDYNAFAVQRTVTYPSDSMRIQGFVESPTRPAITGCSVIDSDKDGVSDDAEKIAGTNPSDSDTDNDGLSDGDEKKAKTDSLKVDTDGDGLTDFEEVITRKTDPLKTDTDGDGYDDKKEIENGFNPLGPGKLATD